jgi:hypothetical protein
LESLFGCQDLDFRGSFCDLAGALGWELDGVVGFFEIKSNFLKDSNQNNQITKYLIKII